MLSHLCVRVCFLCCRLAAVLVLNIAHVDAYTNISMILWHKHARDVLTCYERCWRWCLFGCAEQEQWPNGRGGQTSIFLWLYIFACCNAVGGDGAWWAPRLFCSIWYNNYRVVEMYNEFIMSSGSCVFCACRNKSNNMSTWISQRLQATNPGCSQKNYKCTNVRLGIFHNSEN